MSRTCRAVMLIGTLSLGLLAWQARQNDQRTNVAREKSRDGVPAAASAGSVREQAEIEAESEQEVQRRELVGVWEDEYKGKRTMTLLADGTGAMRVELSGLQAALFAPELRFDMVWELEGRLLKKRTIGGEPAGKVALVLKMKGNLATETILDVTSSRLLLLDENGETEYEWKRVRENADETK